MLSTKPRYFEQHELASLNPDKIPKHVAFIPDGNRRWAIEQRVPKEEGHRRGGDNLIEIVKAATELNIKVITFYLFSTENWARPQDEIDTLMWLLHTFLVEQCPVMLDYGIKLHTIGVVERLAGFVQTTIKQTKASTAHCQGIDMVLALNYGGRDEICRAVRRIANQIKRQEISIEAITEDLISDNLDTALWPDPDLLIRTSGEMRLSNYLLWQLSYSELHVTNVLWPSFRPKHLMEALLDFQSRHRRLGTQ